MKKTLACAFAAILITLPLLAADQTAAKDPGKKTEGIGAGTFAGLAWRSIGPAHTSGRIADFAVNPGNPKQYFVGVASGHIWKTDNAGITWTPVFDNYGAYAIGCLAMDPANPNVVWAGTGENNHQRALGYGDGVYKTVDGGKSWTHMGLKNSRQIGVILIHPKNPDTVYVAAEGSAWGPGGDRGLYKTADGGKTWAKVLSISENTGVNAAVMDPRDPDVLLVTSEQRRRHVFTKIGGGPETAFYKTTDGGKTWRKITSGLPSAPMGGIGLALSPADPDVIYAIIEAAGDAGGFFRSTDRGESWTKMSSYHSSGQYYNEIVCDPKDVDTVYSTETVSRVSRDGGRTWTPLGLDARHVDDHALWIDPRDTAHFLIGGDGGIYETYDGGAKYRFVTNLPVPQFYRVTADDSRPFYYIYGGTQDNNSMGGPSRNTSADGVTSDEWFFTVGGDGFVSQVDPTDTNIVYSEWQYGNIVRFDRRSGESFSIKPQPAKRPADVPLVLGHALPPFASLPHPPLYRGREGFPVRRPGRLLAGDLGRLDRRDRPELDPGHGQVLERRRRGQGRLDLAIRLDRLAGRIAPQGRAAFRRDGRRSHSNHRERRWRVAEGRPVPRRSRPDVCERHLPFDVRRKRRLRRFQQHPQRRF
jgi:Uncharacterized protein related to plant photosystem II stability/assembly factor